jgi:crotonobetainyl-CoA:carnitine CoA-transferase CaiB-like acyl-CoA transferase
MSMPAFGTDGPLADLRAYGTTVEQSSGLPFVNGRSEWPPCLHHVALGDPISGMFGGLALLASIVGRPHAGPATIELSQVECLFQTAAAAIIDEQVGGPRPDAATDRVVPAGAPDRWVLAVEDGHADRCVEVPVQRSDELGHDPQHAATDLWGTLDRRYVGVHSHARQPFRLDGTRPPLRAPAPLLGEHTEEVLAEL